MMLNEFTIAAIDDDHRLRESLESLLESHGYTVQLFESAIAFLDAGGVQNVDCIISDIGLPGMSGLELLRIIQKQRPELPLILITARNDEETHKTYSAQGAKNFFRKPFDGDALLKAVEDACNHI